MEHFKNIEITRFLLNLKLREVRLNILKQIEIMRETINKAKLIHYKKK